MLRVCIAYQPFVLADAITNLLKQEQDIEVLTELPADAETVDVVVFRLAETGELQNFFLSRPLPAAKMIVFSPYGNKAYIRESHQSQWRKIEPFGLADILTEIRKTGQLS